jgi:hypothetical protein
MNSKEFEAVIKLTVNKRYQYFIKKVADYEEVWGLYNDGWAITQDESGAVLIPFWPKKEFAEFCATADWKDYISEKIESEEFIDDWIPGMKTDGNKAAIFWNNNESALPELDVLLKDLELELENY